MPSGSLERPPGRAQLGAGALGERARAAALGELEPLPERAARLGAAVGAAQRGAEVGERARVLEPRRRAREHVHGLAQAVRGRRAALDQRDGPQRDADPARPLPSAAPARGPRRPSGAPARRLPRRRARARRASASARRAGSHRPRARRGGRTRPGRRVPARVCPGRGGAGRAPRAGSCWPSRAGSRRRRRCSRSARSAASTSPRLDQRLDQQAQRERGPERDVVAGEQLERRPRVGLGLRHVAAPQRAPSRDGTVTNASAGIEARARASASIRSRHVVGEVERVGGEQADDERRRTGRRRRAPARRAAGRRRARARCAPPPRPPTRSPGRARRRGSPAPGARPASSPSRSAWRSSRLRRRGAGLEARLLGVGRELGLEQQRQLAIVGLDDLDRRLDRRDGAVGVPDHGQRVRRAGAPTSRAAPARGSARRPPSRWSTASRRREAQLRGAELEQHLAAGRRRRGLRQRPAEPRDGRGGRSARERVRGHPAQELDPLGVAGRLGLDDLRRDPLLGGAARGEDLGGARVRLRALARSRCPRRRPRARSGARTRAAPPASGSRARPAGRRRGPPPPRRAPARRAASARLAPSPSTATARTSAVAAGGLPGEAQEHRLGHRGGPDALARDPRSPESVEKPCSRASRSSASRKNGLPPVASRQAAANSARHRRAEPALAQRRRRLGAQRPRPQHGRLRRRPPAGPARAWRPPRWRVRGEDGEREAVQARRQVVEESQRLRVGPVEVVDEQRDRALVGEVVEQPVEAVQHRERRCRPRAAPRTRRSGANSGFASAAAPSNRRSRSASEALATTGSSSCRTQP